MESLSNEDLRIIRWFDQYFRNKNPTEPTHNEQTLEPYGQPPTDLDKIEFLMEKFELDTIMNKIQW
jgi:hypothetical protein